MDGMAPSEPSAEKTIRTVIEESTGTAGSSEGADEQDRSDVIPDYSWINNFTPSYSLEIFEDEMRSLSKNTRRDQMMKLLGVFEAFGTSLEMDASSKGKSKSKSKAKSKSKVAGTSTDPPASLSQDARRLLSLYTTLQPTRYYPIGGLLMGPYKKTLEEQAEEESGAGEETVNEATIWHPLAGLLLMGTHKKTSDEMADEGGSTDEYTVEDETVEGE